MKLRIARKVLAIVGDEDHKDWRHRGGTVERALNRIRKEDRQAERWWRDLMDFLGPLNRAELVFNLRIREAAETKE